MAQMYYPEKDMSVRVKASNPHPENTEYVVSIGSEMWGGVPQRVLKIQMSYDGKLEGRKSPSYPVGTDDFLRVQDAVKELLSKA